MAGWACPECGTQNDAKATRCIGCGKAARLPPIVLRGTDRGANLRTSQPLRVGRALLARFGEDSGYAAEPQFELVSDADAGVWRVLPIQGTKNATCYAGVKLDSNGAILATGGVIEIGPGKLKLRVELEGA